MEILDAPAFRVGLDDELRVVESLHWVVRPQTPVQWLFAAWRRTNFSRFDKRQLYGASRTFLRVQPNIRRDHAHRKRRASTLATRSRWYIQMKAPLCVDATKSVVDEAAPLDVSEKPPVIQRS